MTKRRTEVYHADMTPKQRAADRLEFDRERAQEQREYDKLVRKAAKRNPTQPQLSSGAQVLVFLALLAALIIAALIQQALF